jgi:hypothetical protein
MLRFVGRNLKKRMYKSNQVGSNGTELATLCPFPINQSSPLFFFLAKGITAELIGKCQAQQPASEAMSHRGAPLPVATPENEGNTTPENEGNTTPENEGNTTPENEGNTTPENEGDTTQIKRVDSAWL